ncbi:replication/maintenance protein RepL [Campylobacter mucosalis]|uniref:replication/maintenance protein RepL n=1 Tax=Campylobacter mucosalis TaxID=202 RepID=UPI003D2A7DFE
MGYLSGGQDVSEQIKLAIFSAILGDKKVKIIDFISQNVDENGFLNITISELCKTLDISKPTAIATFKMLQNAGVLKRIKNGVYELSQKSQI